MDTTDNIRREALVLMLDVLNDARNECVDTAGRNPPIGFELQCLARVLKQRLQDYA